MTAHQPKPPAPQRLQIVESDSHRLLRNASSVDATFVALVTSASHWHAPGPGDVATSAATCLAVRDLPAGHDVVLEAIDPFEEGHLSFTLVRAEWADGRLDVGLQGHPPRTIPHVEGRGGGGLGRLAAVAEALQAGHPVPQQPAPPPRVEREVLRLGTAPGSVARGLLDPARDRPAASQQTPPTCLTCRHSLQMIGLGLGVRCQHPAHNPRHNEGRMDYWTVPGRWYRCPVHQPRPESTSATSHA